MASSSELNKKDKEKIKLNNFFNLSSDEDNSTDNDDEKEMLNKQKINKWDWDREENKSLYYQKNQQASEEFQNKRFKKDIDFNDNKNQALVIKSNLFRIESDSSANFNFLGHTNSVNRIHWCKKYQYNNILLASSMDSKISIWNINDYRKSVLVLDKVHSKSIRNAIWSNQETEIISVSFDQSSVVSNAETGQEINRLKYCSPLSALANHPADENMVIIGAKNEILAWDKRTNKQSRSYKYKSFIGQTQDLLFLNENEFISCGDVVCKESAENSLIAWDSKTAAYISNQIFHEKYICTCLKKHPLNSLFLAQTHGNYIAEFSSNPPFKMNKFKRFESNGHHTAGYSIGFDLNKSGTLLASGSSSGKVFIYNFQSSKLLRILEVYNKYTITQPCTDVKFQINHFESSNEQVLAVSCWNGIVKILNVNDKIFIQNSKINGN